MITRNFASITTITTIIFSSVKYTKIQRGAHDRRLSFVAVVRSNSQQFSAIYVSLWDESTATLFDHRFICVTLRGKHYTTDQRFFRIFQIFHIPQTKKKNKEKKSLILNINSGCMLYICQIMEHVTSSY